MEWQPIDTAPKDGTIILLCDGSSVTAGMYDSRNGKYPWIVLDERTDDRTNGWKDAAKLGPEFWMELPSAP